MADVLSVENLDVTFELHQSEVKAVSDLNFALKAGETLDGLGEYMTYGLCETAAETTRLSLLPIGVAEGCKLKRDVAKDEDCRRIAAAAEPFGLGMISAPSITNACRLLISGISRPHRLNRSRRSASSSS